MNFFQYLLLKFSNFLIFIFCLHYRNDALPSMLRLLLTLRFYATGCQTLVAGDFSGVSKSTVSRVVMSVSTSIAQLFPRFVSMPQGREERITTASNFFRLARFPRVIGAMDCTHVKIQSPGKNNFKIRIERNIILQFVSIYLTSSLSISGGDQAEYFRNRKGYHSYNVQAVCGTDLKFYDVIARWPGSCHDPTIFNNSAIKAKFERGDFHDDILLGDSGYENTPYLATPLLNPATATENLYNESQIRSRNVIERAFGVLKKRFPVLSTGIRSNVENVEAIIIACTVLHNIVLDQDFGFPLHDERVNNGDSDDENDNPNNGNEGRAERRNWYVREHLIRNYFSGLL